ncbi:MAG: acetylpolyamine amidohydrolase [Desulfatirhabdiaceae bacterium]
MIRIRRVSDNTTRVNREVLQQVQDILKEQFPSLTSLDIEKIPDLLMNPMKHHFRFILYVLEGFRGTVKAFALISHEPHLKFCYLDYISTARHAVDGGFGGALYETVREQAISLGATGLFFECLPDDPELCKDPAMLRQNKARLRFYEQYGARPIINTAYETSVTLGDDNPPYLVLDDLGLGKPLRAHKARSIVRAILEWKYAHLCSPEYIENVLNSFRDDPVRLRARRYVKPMNPIMLPEDGKLRKISLIVNDKHFIHHIKERGYVESPVRIEAIRKELETTNLFEPVSPKEFSEKHIRKVHASDYIGYFKRVCKTLAPGKSVYPYVFPIRNAARPPRELAVRAGYYCIDTFTPLNENAFLAAKRAVDCALTGADKILEGQRLAYALVRPPGHHAERRLFGGFCYFNSAAIAAQYLSRYGSVAILDIDYHHGNGQQEIFYERKDVLTISIHGHPKFAYPYFSGFEDEKGFGHGKGSNRV